MIVTTDRLRLEPSGPEYADALHKSVFAEPAVARYVSPTGETLSQAEVKSATQAQAEHWEVHGFGIWVLVERSADDVLGYCGLRSTEAGAEMVYALAPSRWGEGLTSEAAHATGRFAFEVAGLSDLVAWVEPTNVGSLSVLYRLGMTAEGEMEHAGVMAAFFRLGQDHLRPMAGHFEVVNRPNRQR
jgi:RimJ/RimL family protein N-acetyltransferase